MLAAFGLAACGGGGGGGTAKAPEMMPDGDTDTVATGLTEAQLATIRARAEITAAGIGPGSMRADAFPDESDTGVQNAHIINPANELVAADALGAAADPNDIEQVDPSWTRTDSTGAMWKGEQYEQGDADTEGETVVRIIRYHDRAAPGEADYSDYYSNDNVGSRSEITGAVDATGVLTINTTIGDNHALFGGDFGITAPHQMIPAPVDDSTTDGVNEEMVEIDGSFNGVPGKFNCPSTCSRESDADGNLSALGGSWTFTPDGDVADIKVAGVVPDLDYLNFGYWWTFEAGGDSVGLRGLR